MWKRFVVALPLACFAALWFFYLSLPWPVLLRWRNPERTAFMEQRIQQANAKGEALRLRHQWVPLAKISRSLRRAVIVAEDGNFPDHDGVDWAALGEELHYKSDQAFSWTDARDLKAGFAALRYYARNRSSVRGRSTLTQQLAKNLYFSEQRSLGRKVGELLVAGRLEQFLTKDRILELYLNSVEWGPGIFGAEAAARHYFGRSAASLSADQAAALAATLPHPLTSNPKLRPGRMNWRKGLILARMGARGPVQTVPLEPARPDSLSAPKPDSAILPPLVDSMVPRPDTIRRDTLSLIPRE